MEKHLENTTGSFILGSGANNPYWGQFIVLDIGERLNALADEDEKLQLIKVSGKVLVKLTKDDGSGRPGGLMFPVLTLERTGIVDNYSTSENSLEGHLTSRVGGGFEYQMLSTKGIGPKMTFFNPTSTNYEYLYEIPINLTIPRRRRKVFESTSQEEGTRSLHKKIGIYLYGPDGIVQSFCYWTGNLEMELVRKETNLFDDSTI